MNHKFLLALGLAFTSALSTGSARADEFLSSYRFNVGPDVRWWAGNTSTATNGLQFVTHYGADFKFVKPDDFAMSFGSGSGCDRWRGLLLGKIYGLGNYGRDCDYLGVLGNLSPFVWAEAIILECCSTDADDLRKCLS